MIFNKKSQVNAGMVTLALGLIAFWLCIDFGLTLFFINNSTGFSDKDLNTKDYTLSFSGGQKFFNTFIKMATFDIPNLPIVFRFIIVFLEIMSLLVVIIIAISLLSSLIPK